MDNDFSREPFTNLRWKNKPKLIIQTRLPAVQIFNTPSQRRNYNKIVERTSLQFVYNDFTLTLLEIKNSFIQFFQTFIIEAISSPTYLSAIIDKLFILQYEETDI